MQNRVATLKPPNSNRFLLGARYCLTAALFLIFPLLVPLHAFAESPEPGIKITHLSTAKDQDLYYLDAQIEYQLSSEAIEALHSGVRLNFAVDLRIFTQRYSWLRREQASLTHRYTLRYHALSQQYSLFYSNTEEIANFPSLDLALESMGTLRQIPLIDSTLLDAKRDHFLEVRSRLEIESLPLPLRSMAYFNQGWILNSNWSVWALKD